MLPQAYLAAPALCQRDRQFGGPLAVGVCEALIGGAARLRVLQFPRSLCQLPVLVGKRGNELFMASAGRFEFFSERPARHGHLMQLLLGCHRFDARSVDLLEVAPLVGGRALGVGGALAGVLGGGRVDLLACRFQRCLGFAQLQLQVLDATCGLTLDHLEAAEGIVTIANANMSGAIRSRTVQKGRDPREFTLVAFGGAGPMQAAEIADSLGIPEVIVPPYPGITSAMGLLTSDLKYDQMRTVFMTKGAIDAKRLDREVAVAAAELRARLREDGVADGEIEVTAGLDCRYVGQGYELRIPLSEERFTSEALEEFHRLHEQEYGHAFRDPIEIVNLRVTANG